MTPTDANMDGPNLQFFGCPQTQFNGHQTLTVISSTSPDSEEA
jgi:hypothetical protein